MEALPEVYPLTGLQIGDIQSYVSRAFLYFAPLSNRLLILVDNRPWLLNKHSRSALLWQLMVTKYRISPFTNTKARNRISTPKGKTERHDCDTSNHENSKRSYRWFPALDSTKWQEKYLFSMMDLSKSLHGFLVFEVTWKDVHGINYLNKLQTDTSLALEVKFMKKWEFYSPDQALSTTPLWFSGRISEIQSLRNSLRTLCDLDIQQWDTGSSTREIFLQETSPIEVHSDDDFVDVQESPPGKVEHIDSWQPYSKEDIHCNSSDHTSTSRISLWEDRKSLECLGMEESTPTQYADTLLLFSFNDSLLPFKLRQTIVSDLRLLTLLESSLPSWVIFFQSYPLFCHFYRPWMRHLARTLYVMISLVTIIIGFYDLYKNVPLLKATAARLCGPLFSWIEAWDMVSRIWYLGTMLFLQNIEKGLKWLMSIKKAATPVLEAITRPLNALLSEVTEFLSPLWNAFSETFELLTSLLWFLVEFMCSAFLELVDIFVWPFELLYSHILTIATSVYSLLSTIWDLFLVPVRCTFTLGNYMVSLLSNTHELLKDVWESLNSILQLTLLSEARQGAQEISVWKGLWKDLFSKVFRSMRSVINGLVAFLITCNQHRLSLYNHMQAFLLRFARLIRMAPQVCHCQQRLHREEHNEDEYRECDRCK